jgi:hypothetical protein
MRIRIINLLKRVITMLAIVDPRIAKVKELVLVAEAFKSADGSKIDGQRKRSWVLNNVATAFPDAKIKDISFLIEQVIQEI